MPTTQILTYDNTRISSFKNCPRHYQLKHVLNWETSGTKIALVFGGAWHEGMAAILNHKDSHEYGALLEIAMHYFEQEWIKRGLPLDTSTFDDHRTPGLANDMYANWLDQYWEWLQRIEVLETEAPFCVPLFSKNQCPYCMEILSNSYWKLNSHCLHCHNPLTEVYLIGRRDAVYRENGDIWVLETKTSSLYTKEFGFQYKFNEGFHIDSQVDGYYYTTILTYGDCAGVMINACQTNKYAKGKVFKMYPHTRSFESLYAYFREVGLWINDLLTKTNKGPEFFPRQSKACSTPYGFCSFYDVCRFNHTPWLDTVQPLGYEIEKWEPFEEEELKALLMQTRGE